MAVQLLDKPNMLARVLDKPNMLTRAPRLFRVARNACLLLAIFLSGGSAAAQTFEVAVDFGNPGGREPYGRLEQGSDGCLYGTTIAGGKAHGTIFRWCAGATTTLHMFSGGDGSYPEAGLTLGSDQMLYGVTRYGGGSNKGTIFRFNPSTKQASTLHVFTGSNGAEPRGELAEGADGRLYGVAAAGGSSNMGTVFSIGKSGGFLLLRSFTGTNGRTPTGSLVQASDGFWYGTTSLGGAAGLGTVFRISAAGSLTTLHSFNGAGGSIPRAGLIEGKDRYLYGTTTGGGGANQGIVYRMDLAGRVTVLRSFTGGNGASPYSELFQHPDGTFYGTTAFGGSGSVGVLFKMDAAGNITVIRSLTTKDGSRPQAPLLLATNGRLYGVAPSDGPSGSAGTVFEMTTAGGFVRLASFNGTPAMPFGPLMEARDGVLYGASYAGGSSGAGTIFRLVPGVSLEVLHALSNLADGMGPNDGVIQTADGSYYAAAVEGGTLRVGTILKGSGGAFSLAATISTDAGFFPRSNPVQAADGNLYGVMSNGGVPQAGTIYKMSPLGAMTTLHTFNGTTRGRTPYGRVVIGRDNLIYGTTLSGGSSMLGTLFSFDPAAKVLNILHSFSGPEGSSPYAGLIQGTDGRLYGTTSGGGALGKGTIFAFDLGSRQLTRLHSFDSKTGGVPYGTLLEARDGRLYGTTSVGGANGVGAVFSISKTGSGYTMLHSFRSSDGAYPRAGLIEAADGWFYGTAPAGGSANNGVIYRIKPGGGTTPPPPPPPADAFVRVTSPNGPETTWTVGTRGTVKWESDLPSTEKVKIELSLDGGVTFPILIKGSTANDGRARFAIPTSARSTNARVRISWVKDPAVKDVSDQSFVIK